ncbi:MAG: 3-dehydroquinate synthase [Phycisphaerales bacterium]
MTPAIRSISVLALESPGAAYEVVVASGLIESLGSRCAALLPMARRALLVADANVPAGLVAGARDSLNRAGVIAAECPVRASEPDKSLATLEAILQAGVRHRLERGEPIVALGGGIVGDVAGFAAAVYRRGVPVVHCPTTLLSMVDAAIGGKTGINLTVAGALKKNMAGSFHHPVLVLCDVDMLRSLPARELRSGLAECIKHALLGADWGDASLLEFTRSAMPGVRSGDAGAWVELVARNVAIKARVVHADPREERGDHGGRMVLNMGHTVGHAVEAVIGAAHGEAVALGIVAETVCAERLGVSAAGTADRVRGMLELAGLPARASGLPPSDVLIEAMRDDKKVAAGVIRLAVPTGGSPACAVVELADTGVLIAGLDAIRET